MLPPRSLLTRSFRKFTILCESCRDLCPLHHSSSFGTPVDFRTQCEAVLLTGHNHPGAHLLSKSPATYYSPLPPVNSFSSPQISGHLMPFPALFCYDFLLTIPDEARLVWQQKISSASILFILNRYLVLVVVLLTTGGFLHQGISGSCINVRFFS